MKNYVKLAARLGHVEKFDILEDEMLYEQSMYQNWLADPEAFGEWEPYEAYVMEVERKIQFLENCMVSMDSIKSWNDFYEKYIFYMNPDNQKRIPTLVPTCTVGDDELPF